MLEYLQVFANLLPTWLIFITTALLGYLLYDIITERSKNYPPGPRGLPFVGYVPFLGTKPGKVFFDLGKTYGDVVRVSGFGRHLISLNTHDSIKECFGAKGEEFSGRINTKDDIFWLLTDGTGFIREEGAVWKEHRRFALHTLRDFGFGKLSLEERVQEIGKTLVTTLEDTKGEPYDPIDVLANSAFNVILYLTTDKHFDADDPDFVLIRQCVKALLGSATSGIVLLVTASLTKFLPTSMRPGYQAILKVKEDYGDFISRMISEHERTLDEDNPRDYLDAYLIERKKAHTERQEVTSFTIQRLGSNLLNLLLAGTETTSNTIYWALRILTIRPEVQKRLQSELDDVVGRERLPSILDRPNLPYMDAFILELLRFSTITPTSIPHTNPASATLKGFNIPPRSVIFGNIWAVHNDTRYWDEPEKFDPERFMDPATKDKRREHVIAFSVGKRSCLGESLARMELFLFLTMLLQKLEFQLPEGDEGGLPVTNTLVNAMQPYQIRALPRV